MDNKTMNTNFFEKHNKLTILLILLISVGSIIIFGEFIMEMKYGLGNPIIYDSNPLYGYRPLPNQEHKRFGGAKVTFNNLGLRTELKWDNQKDDKILFLGDSVTYGGSYIDDNELFSHLAVVGLQNYKSGNAGVNAWGVENIYGLIVETKLIPAKIYITTLPEGDFYRGLVRLQGLPYFNVKPRYAFLELWYFLCYLQNNNRYIAWQSFANEEQRGAVVQKAVKKLKEIDNFLKERGLQHLIFVTPSFGQAVNDDAIDKLVKNQLKINNLNYYSILDELIKYNLSKKEKNNLFYDKSVHLNQNGHKLWGKIIRSKIETIIKKRSLSTYP